MRRQVEASLKTTTKNQIKKLKILSERQDKPPGVRNEESVKVHDNIELPGWVYELLSMITKHSIRYKFIKAQILADINNFCPHN